MAKRRAVGIPTAEAIDDIWQRQATTAAIVAIRSFIRGGAVRPTTLVSQLTDVELGWLFATSLFAWISARAEQATAQGWDVETTLRTTALDLQPWDYGAIVQVLPELGASPGIDWSKPLGAWPKSAIVHFLLQAMKLIDQAMIARDVGGNITTKQKSLDEMQRIASAEVGGSLLAPNEVNDEIPPV